MRVVTCSIKTDAYQSVEADEVEVVLILRRDGTHPVPHSQFSDEVHNGIAEFLDEQILREEAKA